jgi:hypothetical protein
MITNDADFKQALDELEVAQQRRVGAAFVRNVLALNPVVTKVVDAAANEDTTVDELAVAFKQAKAAALDSHTRCGSDSDWQAQAGYFVARAASVLVAPTSKPKHPRGKPPPMRGWRVLVGTLTPPTNPCTRKAKHSIASLSNS